MNERVETILENMIEDAKDIVAFSLKVRLYLITMFFQRRSERNFFFTLK